jgi:alpha-L-fucosidase
VKPIAEDLRWVGNEQAKALLTNWCVYPPPGEEPGQATGGRAIWFPAECDTMMNGHWFWDENPPKDLPTLLNFYYTSVGRGSILMLNVAPDKRGKFSDECVQRLHEFHDALQKIFGTDLAAGKKVTASNVRGNDAAAFGATNVIDPKRDKYWSTDDNVTTASLEIDLGGDATFNVFRSEEVIALGQRVQAYTVEALVGGEWKTVATGTTVGHRKLDRFPKVTASKVRFTITKSRACPVIRSVGVHLDTVSPASAFEPANALSEPKTRQPRTTTQAQ